MLVLLPLCAQLQKLLSDCIHPPNPRGVAEQPWPVVDAWFDNERPKIEFGNARSARRLLDEMVAKHARRIHQMEDISEDDLVLLLPEDVAEV